MRHWTAEERNRQAALIRTWTPWKKSTGPTSAAGKERSKMNALKNGTFPAVLREASKVIAECGVEIRVVKKRSFGQN